MDAFIVEGDSTTHAGVGDMVTCPRCGGVYRIVTSNNPGFNLQGRPAAFEGDKTACGASLISSQTLARARVSMGPGGTCGKTATHEATSNAADSYRGRFQVLDEVTGKPAPLIHLKPLMAER
ncbi:PAAR domain-containing protein [Burkholderia ubonensis]|uniref:PAAR domain-containing protein n=1 Tax=Burkholderia ubonensis TaxID=101571 RepID=UPI000A8AA5D6|nr:PAAR domain-containing protein [Burkholderia ubonensis]